MLDTLLHNLTLPVMPPAEALITCALGAVAISFILAGSFGTFFAVAAEFLFIRTKRTFYARTARQAAQMTLTAGVVATIVSGGAAAWTAKGEPALLAAPYTVPLVLTGVLILTSLVLLALSIRIQSGKSRTNGTHVFLSLAAGACAALSFFCGTGVVRRLLHSPPEWDVTLPLSEQVTLFFSIPPESFFWPLLLESLPLGAAFAAAFACLWLLLMRDRQDYGRDYYAFALPYCAKGAYSFTLLAVLAGAFVFYESRELMLPELSHDPSLPLDIASAALPLLGCAFWLFISRSAHPMRHKISVVLACLFLLLGFTGQLLMLNKVIPSP